MTRKLLAAALMATMATLAGVGCGEGYDTEDATEECDLKRADQALKLCMNNDAYLGCIACFEECGEGCATVSTVCPTQFTCPEE